jgi:hypothetical protein
MTQRPFVAITICLFLASCGEDNGLGGSLGEVFPLDISRVELHKNEEAFQVTYLRNRGVFLDSVIRLSISLDTDGTAEDGGVPRLELKPGTRIPLSGMAPSGIMRTSVTTAPGGEPSRNLPHVLRGDLVITAGGNVGEFTKGNFSMLFEQTGGDVGFGRTLTGTFAGDVKDAGFEPWPPDAGP